MNRIEQIRARFTQHFQSIGATPVPMTPEEWQSIDNQDNLRVKFGIRRVDLTAKEGCFCPELIAQQTSHLDEQDLRQYLDAMQFVVDCETSLDDFALDEASTAADAHLAEVAPGSLRLLPEVQMAWLDKVGG